MTTFPTQTKPISATQSDSKRRLTAAFANLLEACRGRVLFKVSTGRTVLKLRESDRERVIGILEWLTTNAANVTSQVQLGIHIRGASADLRELLNPKS